MGDGPDVRGQLLAFAQEIRQARDRERELTVALEDAHARLDDAYLSTIQMLAIVVEARDETTAAHLQRTSERALALARRIAPDLVARPQIAYGFLLHDIGKIGIPESVLGKEGPLVGPEWELMRTHPEIGARIVAPMAHLDGAAEVIHSHHERFDGSGYPRGLRGDEIPLAARIFAVADAYDAMTSDRPYRAALPKEVALDEVLRGAGSQFDPEVVKVFIELEQGADGPDHPHHGPVAEAG